MERRAIPASGVLPPAGDANRLLVVRGERAIALRLNGPLLWVQLRGHRRVRVGDREWGLSGGDMMIAPAQSAFASARSARSLAVLIELAHAPLPAPPLQTLVLPLAAHDAGDWARETSAAFDGPDTLDRRALARAASARAPAELTRLLATVEQRLDLLGARRLATRIRLMNRLEKARLLAADPGAVVDLAGLADAVGVSPFHLQRHFTALFGVSPGRANREARLGQARASIEAGGSIARAAAMAGYSDPANFTRAFRRAFGVTPGRARRAAAKESAVLQVTDCASLKPALSHRRR